jgi:hypothetical protein
LAAKFKKISKLLNARRGKGEKGSDGDEPDDGEAV